MSRIVISLSRHERSADFHIRIPKELEEKLELHSQMKHLSLSQTCRYFITLGIKSTDMLEELKNDPDKKNSIIKEWESVLSQILTSDTVQEEMTKISDDDLDVVIMMLYCEFGQRKRSRLKAQFKSDSTLIENHVESYMDKRIQTVHEKPIETNSVNI